MQICYSGYLTKSAGPVLEVNTELSSEFRATQGNAVDDGQQKGQLEAEEPVLLGAAHQVGDEISDRVDHPVGGMSG